MHDGTHPRDHNQPPDPIDEIAARYEAEREEAENWLDGEPVETEDQMKAVDELRAAMRKMRIDFEKGQKSAAAPLYDAYKAEQARWKPTIDDAKRIEQGLVRAVDAFKRKLAAEREEAERAARAEAERKRREAERAAAQAREGDIESERAAAAAQASPRPACTRTRQKNAPRVRNSPMAKLRKRVTP